MMFRRLYLVDHLLNGLLALVSVAIGSLSITTLVGHRDSELYLILIVVSSFLLFVWYVIRLLPLFLIVQLLVDVVLRLFGVVVAALYLFNQYPSRYNKTILILTLIQIILASMTLVSCYVVYSLTLLGLATAELDSEQSQSSSSSKTSQTKISIDEYFKQKPKSSSVDNDNWMNVSVPKPMDLNDQFTVTESKSVPNFRLSMNGTEYTQDFKTYNIPKSSSSKSHETLIPNSASDSSIAQTFDGVKRSKTTGQLNNPRINKRQQRWNSINDERVFLENINESLLPAVLKKGESPILALRRQQQTLESGCSSIESNKTLSEGITTDPEYIRDYNYNSKFADKSVEFGQLQDDTSENLPYISEFEEPGHLPPSNDSFDDQFKDFDQTTRMEVESDLEDFKIPRTMKKQWINKTPSMNHISITDWNETAQTYKNFRSRSGVNLNIPGISRIVSDHNLLHDSQLTLTQDTNYLLPALDQRADNIDNLSDILSTSHSIEVVDSANGKQESLIKPIFTHLNRSMSAPSLQTFRNVSTDSKSSVVEVSDGSFRITTPPPFEEDIEQVKQSPIKRLYNSPKKLFRRSIDQIDAYQDHKHTNSMMSMQFSLYSSPSKLSSTSPKRASFNKDHQKSLSIGSNGSRSRSTSPKRSFKSLLSRKPSTNQINHKLTVAPPTLLKQAQVKKLDLEQEPDFWEIRSSLSVVNSRVSSIPSAVIGQYDKEKWSTLKFLNDV